MLTQLGLTNFKSWKEIQAMRLAPITGLFGTNSSGKTSILQFLLMLKQTAESPDRAQVLNLGDAKSLVSLGSFRDMVFAHRSPATLTMSLSWEASKPLKIADPQEGKRVLFQGERLGFEATIAETAADGRVRVERMTYTFSEHRFTMQRRTDAESKYELNEEQGDFRFLRAQGRPWNLPSPVKYYGFPDQVKAYFQNAGFLADLELALEQILGQVYYLGPLREYPQRQYTWAGTGPADMGRRGGRAIEALLAARERGEMISRGKGRAKVPLEEYVAQWLQRLGLIHEFAVEPIAKNGNLYQVWIRKTPKAARVLITDVGFGVSQILPVLVLCYYVPKGSILLLEQPEIHLHPSVQAGLADVFIDAIKTRGIQIVFESHSEHLLKRLQRRIAEEGVSADDFALYFCAIGSEGASRLTKLDVDDLGTIRNWPKDFFGDDFGEMAAATRAAMNRKKAMGA